MPDQFYWPLTQNQLDAISSELNTFEMAEDVARDYADYSFMHGMTDTPIDRCKKRAPCNSALCPICLWKFSLWWLYSSTMFVSQFPSVIITKLSDRRDAIPAGKLRDFDLIDFIARFSSRLNKSPATKDLPIIGAFNLNLNIDEDDKDEAYYQPYLSIVWPGVKGDIVKLRSDLSKYYPKSKLNTNPISSKVLGDKSAKPLSSVFMRKYPLKSRSVGNNGKHHIKTKSLPDDRIREMMNSFGQYQPVDRLFLNNVDRQGIELVIDN